MERPDDYNAANSNPQVADGRPAAVPIVGHKGDARLSAIALGPVQHTLDETPARAGTSKESVVAEERAEAENIQPLLKSWSCNISRMKNDKSGSVRKPY